MGKIYIQVEGKEPRYIHYNNEDKLVAYLKDCGYTSEEIKGAKQWALAGFENKWFGPTYNLPGATLRMEQGNVETIDAKTGDWIDSPPEMEAFLADIYDVCRNHGLCLCADDDGICTSYLVRAYEPGCMSLIESAAKDYDFSEIKVQPRPARMPQKWEFKHLFVDLYGGIGPTPEDPWEAVASIHADGISYFTPWWQKELENILNEYGSFGWEIATVNDSLLRGEETTGYIVLKRPLRS